MIESTKKYIPTVGILAAAFVLLRYFRSAVITAIFIIVLSYILHRAVDYLKKRLNIPKSIGCIVLMLSFGTALTFFGAYLGRRAVFECKRICQYIADNADTVAMAISELADSVSGGVFALFEYLGIDFFDSFDVYAAVFELVVSFATDAARALPSAAIGIGVSLPDLLLAVVSAVFAIFYLARDWNIIMAWAAKIMPVSWRSRTKHIKEALFDALKSWIKTSLFGAAISFLITFLGTSVLKFDCPLIISLISAVIDALPVVGCGLMLVPWGIFLIVGGAKYEGVGLIIIYAAVFLARKISEPRLLVSKSDVHPLFALVLLYFCTRFFGIVGALVTPIVISLFCEANQGI